MFRELYQSLAKRPASPANGSAFGYACAQVCWCSNKLKNCVSTNKQIVFGVRTNSKIAYPSTIKQTDIETDGFLPKKIKKIFSSDWNKLFFKTSAWMRRVCMPNIFGIGPAVQEEIADKHTHGRTICFIIQIQPIDTEQRQNGRSYRVHNK